MQLIQRILNKVPYFPFIGLPAYVVFTVWAGLKYPGGSINDPNASGFSYFNNFFCDLMVDTTENGIKNPARPIAMIGHIFLSVSMIIFFAIVPEIFKVKNFVTRSIQVFGVISMVFFIFFYTKQHDTLVWYTGVSGTLASLFLLYEIFKFNNKGLISITFLALILSIFNFVSFVSGFCIDWLPFIQKFSFLIDAIWVFWICAIVIKKRKNTVNPTSPL